MMSESQKMEETLADLNLVTPNHEVYMTLKVSKELEEENKKKLKKYFKKKGFHFQKK